MSLTLDLKRMITCRHFSVCSLVYLIRFFSTLYIILWQHSDESEKLRKEVVTHYCNCFLRVVRGDKNKKNVIWGKWSTRRTASQGSPDHETRVLTTIHDAHLLSKHTDINNVQYSWVPRWRSWLRHRATSQKVAGSIPDGVIGIFHRHNPSGRTMALGSTQPLREMSTGNISWG